MDTLRLHYSGRVTAGRLRRFNTDKVAPPLSDDAAWWGRAVRVHGLEESLSAKRALGLSSVPNLRTEPERRQRKPRGSMGISAYGRQKVLSTSRWLEENCGRNTLSFLTLTIPPEACVPELFQNFSTLIKSVREALVYHLRRSGLPGQLVGVVEVQESRQKTAGSLPMLHLHIAFQGRKPRGHWVLTPALVDSIWKKILSGILEEEIEVTAACQIVRVKSSCSGYLGKYMSKGVKTLESIEAQYLPSAWYVCTRALSRMVKIMEVYLTGSVATEWYDRLRATPGLLRFSKDVYRWDEDGWMVPVGWYGELMSRNTYWEIRERMGVDAGYYD